MNDLRDEQSQNGNQHQKNKAQGKDKAKNMNVVIPFNQPEEKPGLWDISENIIRP